MKSQIMMILITNILQISDGNTLKGKFLRGFTKSKKKHMLKNSAFYLIGEAEIPIRYTIWADVEQSLLKQSAIRF